MPSLKTLLASAAMASLAQAETFIVTATQDNTFDPDTVEAAEGDIIEFRFEPSNHSVVAGDFDNACAPLAIGEGFYSGFIPTDDTPDVRHSSLVDSDADLLGHRLPRHTEQHGPHPFLLFPG